MNTNLFFKFISDWRVMSSSPVPFNLIDYYFKITPTHYYFLYKNGLLFHSIPNLQSNWMLLKFPKYLLTDDNISKNHSVRIQINYFHFDVKLSPWKIPSHLLTVLESLLKYSGDFFPLRLPIKLPSSFPYLRLRHKTNQSKHCAVTRFCLAELA